MCGLYPKQDIPKQRIFFMSELNNRTNLLQCECLAWRGWQGGGDSTGTRRPIKLSRSSVKCSAQRSGFNPSRSHTFMTRSDSYSAKQKDLEDYFLYRNFVASNLEQPFNNYKKEKSSPPIWRTALFWWRCLADSNRRRRFCRPLTKPLIQGTVSANKERCSHQLFWA